MDASSHPIDLEHLLAHADWIRGLAYALTRDASEAEEVEQETWLAALRYPPGSERSDLRAWLATVARNLARRRKRAAARRADHERLATSREVDDPALVAERVAWQRELADRVLALPETYRTAVALRYFEGLEPAAIAQRLAITPENARQRVARGLALLRIDLDREHGSRARWMACVAPLALELPAPVPLARPSGTRPVRGSPATRHLPWREWLAVKTVQRAAVVVLFVLLGWIGWRAIARDSTRATSDERVETAENPDAVRGTPTTAPTQSGTRELASAPPPASPTADARAQAELVFLVHPAGPAPEHSRWTLESSDKRETIAIDVPASGRVRVPAGAWTLREISGTWSPASSRIELAPEEEQLVWVGTEQLVDVLVVDPRSRPIAGATVEWNPFVEQRNRDLADDIALLARPAVRERTDASGQAHLRWRGIVQGKLRVRGDARAPEELPLHAPQTEPLRVVLGDADAGEVELSVVDAADGTPWPEVELVNTSTFVTVRTDADGRARIRTRSPAEASFVVRGAGAFPMQIDPDGASKLHAARITRLVVRCGSAADRGERAALALRIASVEPPIDGGPLPELMRADVELPFERHVEVPQGAHVEATLVSARGRGATGAVDVVRGQTELALAFDDADVLRVVVRGPGAATARARVVPRYESGAFDALPVDDVAGGVRDRTVVALPCASRLERIEVRAPHCAPLVLRRSRESAAAARGEVEVELLGVDHALDVTCVDEDGLPLAGVRLEPDDKRHFDWFRAHPELHGARPSSHPAWVESLQRSASAITDIGGHARLMLASPAETTVWAWIPASQADEWPLIATSTRDVTTPGERELRWVLPRARRVTLHAFDAADGAPVERFEVVDPDGATSSPGSGQGGMWQGWVPARARRLAVRAPDERTGEVDLPRWDPDHANVTLRVELGRALTSTLVLEGPAAEELRGQSIRVVAEKADKDPSQQGMVDWQAVLAIEDPANIRVALPLPNAVVNIYEEQAERGPYRYRFTPERLTWRQGERNVIRVERR